MSEIWYRTLIWSGQIEEVEVLRVTGKTVTYISEFYNKPQRTFSRSEFFATPEEASQALLSDAEKRVKNYTNCLERATRRLQKMKASKPVVVRLKKPGAA